MFIPKGIINQEPRLYIYEWSLTASTYDQHNISYNSYTTIIDENEVTVIVKKESSLYIESKVVRSLIWYFGAKFTKFKLFNAKLAFSDFYFWSVENTVFILSTVANQSTYEYCHFVATERKSINMLLSQMLYHFMNSLNIVKIELRTACHMLSHACHMLHVWYSMIHKLRISLKFRFLIRESPTNIKISTFEMHFLDILVWHMIYDTSHVTYVTY